MAARDSLAEVSIAGAFVRTASVFRNWVTEDGEFPVAKGRYLLYVSKACPWASRCLFVLALKGITSDIIDVVVVSPLWDYTKKAADEHRGWVFDASYPGCSADPIFGASSLRAVYEQAAAAGGAAPPSKFTVPLLLDTQTRRIVNNESSEILRSEHCLRGRVGCSRAEAALSLIPSLLQCSPSSSDLLLRGLLPTSTPPLSAHSSTSARTSSVSACAGADRERKRAARCAHPRLSAAC